MTMRRSRLALAAPLLAAALLAFGAGGARAQTSTTGALEGVVRDAFGDPLADALLTLAVGEGTGAQSILTGDGGRFRFPFLAPGTYEITVELLGFRPLRLTDIPVRPGRVTRVTVELEAVSEASPEPVTLRFDGASEGASAGSGEWLPNPRLLPAERQELRELARLSSRTGESLEHEGLPGAYMSLELDGTTFRAARHAAVPAAAQAPTGFALRAYEAGMVMGAPASAAGEAGIAGLFGAHSFPGSERRQLDLDVRWSGDVLPGSSVENGDVPPYTDILAGATLRGSSAERAAGYMAGISFRRLERPTSAAWPESEAAIALLSRASDAGVNVSGYGPGVLEDQAISAFGSAALPVGERHRLNAGFHFAHLPSLESVREPSGLVLGLEGTDIAAGAALQSALGPVDNELRLAFTSSARESVAGDSLRPTFFVSDALALGGNAPAARAEESGVRLTDALTFRAGPYTLTAGASVLFASYLQRSAPREAIYFGGLPQLAAGVGIYERFEPGPDEVEWSEPAYAAFAEVRTAPAPGLDVQIGVRAEREGMPADEVRTDSLWLVLTGLNNARGEDAKWRMSPRAAVEWDLNRDGRWLLDLSAGIYHERHDPLLLAAWQQEDGTATLRRFAGTVAWPWGAMGDGVARNRLLLIAPGFEPIRSTRFAGGLRHALAPGTSLQVSGVARSTKNLPRRIDLNLPVNPAYRDQYERPVYVALVKQGSLLATASGAGRRFGPWDEVAGIESDAEGKFWGLTGGVERDVAAGLSVRASYTYSHTTDDWYGGREGGWLLSRPTGLPDAAWADGTSDFDVPHRFAAGGSYEAPFGVTVAALFRVESGRPFTPGFRYGVDANGDGVFGNDPAFVDAAVPGMDQLLGEWSCLSEAAGRYVERNACRAEAVQALDLAARVRLLRLGGASAAVMVEALGLLDSGMRIPDTALYLVDPEEGLVVDDGARTVSVPLLANLNFGKPLVRREVGRRLRVGVAVNW